jgi:hypothetical protein
LKIKSPKIKSQSLTFIFDFTFTDIYKYVFGRPCSRFSCRPSGHEPNPSLLGLETTTATANVRNGT